MPAGRDTATAHGRAARPPAPTDLDDAHAFYVAATDDGMARAGIMHGDHYLVTPNAGVKTYGRVWVRHRENGTEQLKWLICWWEGGFEIVSWTGPAATTQKGAPSWRINSSGTRSTSRGSPRCTAGDHPSRGHP